MFSEELRGEWDRGEKFALVGYGAGRFMSYAYHIGVGSVYSFFFFPFLQSLFAIAVSLFLFFGLKGQYFLLA